MPENSRKNSKKRRRRKVAILDQDLQARGPRISAVWNDKVGVFVESTEN